MNIFKYKNGKFVITEGYGSTKTYVEEDKEPEQQPQKPIPGTENPKTFAAVSFRDAKNIVDIKNLSKVRPEEFEAILDNMYAWGKKNNIKFNENKITDEIINAAEKSLDVKRPQAPAAKPQVKSSLSDKDVAKLTDPRVGPTPSGPLKPG